MICSRSLCAPGFLSAGRPAGSQSEFDSGPTGPIQGPVGVVVRNSGHPGVWQDRTLIDDNEP